MNHWASQVDLFFKIPFSKLGKKLCSTNRDVLYTAETKETETLRDIFACHFDPTIPVFCFCSGRLSAHLSIRCSSFSLLIILPFFFFFSVEILVIMLMIVISYSTSALVISSMSRLCLSSSKKKLYHSQRFDSFAAFVV